MTQRQQHLASFALAGVLVAAGSAAAWFAPPVEPWSPPPPGNTVDPSAPTATADEPRHTITAEDRSRVEGLRLQGSDAVTAAPKPPAVASASGLVLLGTMVSSDGVAEGIFRDANGRLQVVSPGDTVDGARLDRVTDGQAELTLNGRSLQLQTARRKAMRDREARGTP